MAKEEIVLHNLPNIIILSKDAKWLCCKMETTMYLMLSVSNIFPTVGATGIDRFARQHVVCMLDADLPSF